MSEDSPYWADMPTDDQMREMRGPRTSDEVTITLPPDEANALRAVLLELVEAGKDMPITYRSAMLAACCQLRKQLGPHRCPLTDIEEQLKGLTA